jgi:hypothetical protein
MTLICQSSKFVSQIGASLMPLNVDIRTSLRMDERLHNRLSAAAKSNGHSFSDEVRQRLATSFAGKSGVTDERLDEPTKELLEGIGRMAAKLAEIGYRSWYEDPFAHRVLATAILKFMRRSIPKGEAIPNPKPGTPAAEGFYGKRATVDGVAAALASSAEAIADYLAAEERR